MEKNLLPRDLVIKLKEQLCQYQLVSECLFQISTLNADASDSWRRLWEECRWKAKACPMR